MHNFNSSFFYFDNIVCESLNIGSSFVPLTDINANMEPVTREGISIDAHKIRQKSVYSQDQYLRPLYCKWIFTYVTNISLILFYFIVT